MERNGIAWMIAGGVRAQSAEDRRQRVQRVDLAHSTPTRGDALSQLRQRIVDFASARSSQSTLSADCCAA
jgi:hypothetical protein